jgi:ribosomal protein S18 acetylase RimI-like enzyme
MDLQNSAVQNEQSRVIGNLHRAEEIRIVDFSPALRDHFNQINRAWIEKYFWVEPIDDYVLTQPEEAILRQGGHILFAMAGDEVAGTVALKKTIGQTFELTKMGVYDKFHGMQLGELLVTAALEKAKSAAAQQVILYSHTSLNPAIHIYRKLGFAETPLEPGLYKRSDIKMRCPLFEISVRHARLEDSEMISETGMSSFYDTFHNVFERLHELETYMDKTYNPDKLRKSLQNENNFFLLALVNGANAGFIKLKKQARQKNILAERQSELQKFYVKKEYHGLGIAQTLMDQLNREEVFINPQCTWLDVLILNVRAIRFYEKNGFRKVGNHEFTIGTQVFYYDVMSREAADKKRNHQSA